MKVVMGAYACEPSQGSEPAVGWHWAREAVAAGHDVWVITRRNNRAAIEAELASAHGAVPHFEYLDLPAPFRWMKRRGGHSGLLAYYYAWQIGVALRARALHRRHEFDLAHHVTFVNDWLPSGLCVLPIPFVWGPVGGSTHRLPEQVALDLPAYARRHERIRAAFQIALGSLDPFVRLTRRRADVILVYTREALAGLPERDRQRARAVVHIGVDPDITASVRPRNRETRRLHVLTGGRLVHWKGYDLLLEGFAAFVRAHPDVDSRLVVTGSGRYRSTLERLAAREGIADRIEWTGYLPSRDDVAKRLRESDLYALPTLRDGPPVALLEAMAHGVPVLCLDHGATAELVPDGAGFKIAACDRSSIIAGVADACAKASSETELAAEMGRFGRAHASTRHAWAAIRGEIERAYRDAKPEGGATPGMATPASATSAPDSSARSPGGVPSTSSRQSRS
jgi:glycosyltransferase involved in cell wall biosynthesis